MPKIRLNQAFLSYQKGRVLDLEKVPLQELTFFLDRIKDAERDNCVTIIEDKAIKPKTKKKSGGKE